METIYLAIIVFCLAAMCFIMFLLLRDSMKEDKKVSILRRWIDGQVDMTRGKLGKLIFLLMIFCIMLAGSLVTVANTAWPNEVIRDESMYISIMLFIIIGRFLLQKTINNRPVFVYKYDQ